MPNTANYSFPTPADTDLVKNGADAIRDLGDAVDTAMNTALGTKKSGMVLLSSVAFSAVASQSFNDVFSATYDNYRIVLVNTAGSGDITFRLRVSGTDTTTNYQSGTVSIQLSGTVSLTGFNSGTFGTTSIFLGNAQPRVSFDVLNPFAAVETRTTGGNVGGGDCSFLAGRQTGATSFTGFTILAGTNMTGKVSVYGYNL
jgi:hypothetical protein